MCRACSRHPLTAEQLDAVNAFARKRDRKFWKVALRELWPIQSDVGPVLYAMRKSHAQEPWRSVAPRIPRRRTPAIGGRVMSEPQGVRLASVSGFEAAERYEYRGTTFDQAVAAHWLAFNRVAKIARGEELPNDKPFTRADLPALIAEFEHAAARVAELACATMPVAEAPPRIKEAVERARNALEASR